MSDEQSVRVGHQVSVRASRPLVDEFERWFRETGDVLALAQPTPTADFVEAQSLRPEESPGVGSWPFLLLARRSDLDLVGTRLVATQGYYLIDKLRSPVVEFGPGYDPTTGLASNEMGGRLWFPTSYWNDRDELVRLPDEFIAWGDRLLRWFRRHKHSS